MVKSGRSKEESFGFLFRVQNVSYNERKILKGDVNMLNYLTKKDRRSNIEKEIDSVLDRMKVTDPSTKEYSAMNDNVERLYKAKAHARSAHVTPDAVLLVAGNLMGLWMIMNFEKTEILRTKALSFVLKGRI